MTKIPWQSRWCPPRIICYMNPCSFRYWGEFATTFRRDNRIYSWGLWQVSMPVTSFNLSCTLQLHEVDIKVSWAWRHTCSPEWCWRFPPKASFRSFIVMIAFFFLEHVFLFIHILLGFWHEKTGRLNHSINSWCLHDLRSTPAVLVPSPWSCCRCWSIGNKKLQVIGLWW